jgi:hypothetical protein
MDTTIQKCLQTFDLKECQINREILRKTYFKCALQYHPDKQQESTSEKFNEIQEHYEILMKYYGYMDDDECDIELEDSQTSFIVPSYVQNIKQYFQPFLENELIQEIKTKLLSKVLAHLQNKCEYKAINLFQNMPIEKCEKIIDFMEKQSYIPESFIEKIRLLCKEKDENTKIIRIFPTLSDILIDNLYKLNENGVEYYIPLWHHELIYDNCGQDLCIEIYPQLDKNINIDENNNIHISKTFSIQELWETEKIEFIVGNKKISFPRENLKLTNQQTITIPNNGISLINSTNIYDNSQRGSILINISLTLN